MLGLAIHTSSPQLGLMLQSVAPDPGEGIERYQVWDLGREVSSHLHVKLVEFIAPHSWQDLSFIAVDKGPGGFTGTRIGVVAARTLAQQLKIPLFGVSSTAALAACATLGDEPGGKDIAIAMPAKREAVFGAIYRPNSDGDLQPVLEDEVIPVDKWNQILANRERPVEQVTTEIGEGIAESVTGVMAIAYVRWMQGQRPGWESVMPFYGQHPVNR
ncbi:MAG: tRNA (adenosine(37)-N6)-threonylcarbamoyltransferase complex dimerization subunit type 1 TsaB [Phormidesmis sp.]